MMLLSVEGVEGNLGPLAEQDKIDQCCNTWHSRTRLISVVTHGTAGQGE